jgi:hypothetical protein
MPRFRIFSGRSILLSCFCAAAGVACRRSPIIDLPLWRAGIDPSGREVRVVQLPYEQISHDMKTHAIVRRVLDQNHDGISDRIIAYDGVGGARSEETDTDFDGKLDLWESFGPAGQRLKMATSRLGGAPDQIAVYDASGRLKRVDSDSDLDGRVDITRIYESGVLSENQIDSDSSGRPDRYQDLRAGYMSFEQFDTDEDGSPDLRMEYDRNGQLLRVKVLKSRDAAR